MINLIRLTCILLLFVGCKRDNIKLKLNLNEGERYIQNYSINSISHQKLNGFVNSVNTKIDSEMSFDVVSKNDEFYDMRVTYQRLFMKFQTTTGVEIYSSDAEKRSDPRSQVLEAICKKSFDVKMNLDGTIREVYYLNDIIKEEISKVNFNSKKEKRLIANSIMDSFGRETFDGKIESITAIFPEENVSIGTEWSKDRDIISSNSKLRSNYQLVEFGEGSAVLTVHSALEPLERSENSIALEGDVDAEIEIDPSNGWIISAKIKQSIAGAMRYKDSPDSLKLTMSNTIKISD